jgi:hypothetical protein
MKSPPLTNRFQFSHGKAASLIYACLVVISQLAFAPAFADNGKLSTSPVPLLQTAQPVDWWFVFKFNTKTFPGCSDGEKLQSCPFGGTVQDYPTSQQFVFASSEQPALQKGGGCLGGSVADPVGATFDAVYKGDLFYVLWNDQFYGDPPIAGCGDGCGGPWGHSKGLLAWNESGEGLVLQVSTPSWPAAGSNQSPRTTDGNTLGCVKDDDVKVSQHFFSLKLSQEDVLQLLQALLNASVVTDPENRQIVRNGGPHGIQALVSRLGQKSAATSMTRVTLSSGVVLISKPSHLNVPPWQMVSAALGGIPLRTATWWANPKIGSSSASTAVRCWDAQLKRPGAVKIATSGHWGETVFSLEGGPSPDGNHAKIGVSMAGTHDFSIFGDMNQQGALSGKNCASSQNGRGGIFYVIDNASLANGIRDLIKGSTAPIGTSTH